MLFRTFSSPGQLSRAKRTAVVATGAVSAMGIAVILPAIRIQPAQAFESDVTLSMLSDAFGAVPSLDEPLTEALLTEVLSTDAFPTDTTSRLAQAAGFPTLTVESTGDAVVQLQGMLQLLGFYQGAIDGTYSPSTQTAVSQFQSVAGIAADGIVGPSTWQKLLPQPADIQTVAAQPAPVASPVASTPAPDRGTAEPIAPIVPSGPPILRPGAEGPAVSQLQRELQELGYYDGDIDGGYGELTQAAVEKFQREKQLTVDAIVGPSTWDALSQALDS